MELHKEIYKLFPHCSCKSDIWIPHLQLHLPTWSPFIIVKWHHSEFNETQQRHLVFDALLRAVPLGLEDFTPSTF